MTDRIDTAKNIQLLIKIQTVAKTLYTMDQENDRQKNTLNNLEQNYKNAEKEYLNTQETIEKIDSEIIENKSKIELHIERIKKLKDKEKYIKTQKEYIALDTEISLARDDIKELEKQINEKENIKNISLNKELKNKKTILEEKEKEYKQTKIETDEKLRELENQRSNARKTKEQITPELDPYLLKRYENIVKKKEGLGIVPIVDGICEGCYIAITPQLKSKLMQNREIIYCPNCARILYLPQRKDSI